MPPSLLLGLLLLGVVQCQDETKTSKGPTKKSTTTGSTTTPGGSTTTIGGSTTTSGGSTTTPGGSTTTTGGSTTTPGGSTTTPGGETPSPMPSSLHFITFNIQTLYLKNSLLEGKNENIFRTDLTLALKQGLKMANGGVQLKSHVIDININEKPNPIDPTGARAAKPGEGKVNIDVLIGFDEPKANQIFEVFQQMMKEFTEDFGKIQNISHSPSGECTCDTSASACSASCEQGLKYCKQMDGEKACYKGEVCNTNVPCQDKWLMLRTDFDTNADLKNLTETEQNIQNLAQKAVHMAMGSHKGDPATPIHHFIQAQIRKAELYLLKKKPPNPSEIMNGIASIDFFLQSDNPSEVEKLGSAISMALSSDGVQGGTKVSNPRSFVLDIHQCVCNASEPTGLCSVPCGNGKKIIGCPSMTWCIKSGEVCSNKACMAGQWSDWTNSCATPCTKTCGGGSCKRMRKCQDPNTQNILQPEQCDGSAEDFTLCNEWDCEEACTGGQISFAIDPSQNPENPNWNRIESCSCGCKPCTSKDMNIKLNFLSNETNWSDPTKQQELATAIKTTLNNIWTERKKENEMAPFPDLLAFKVSNISIIPEDSEDPKSKAGTPGDKNFKLEATVQLLVRENQLNGDSVGNATEILKTNINKPADEGKVTPDPTCTSTPAVTTTTTTTTTTTLADTKRSNAKGPTLFEKSWNEETTLVFPNLPKITPDTFEIKTNDTCFYCAKWLYPDFSKEIHFEITTKVLEITGLGDSPEDHVWSAIGFSKGTKMSDGIDAVLAVNFGWSPRGDLVQSVWFKDYSGPDMSTSRPARRSRISSVNGYTNFKFSKLVNGDHPFDHNFSEPVNIIFPISGGLFHYHNLSVPYGLYPKLDARKHFMSAPFILPNITMRQCSKTKRPIDGQWSPWSEWTDCPVTCGESHQEKKRFCDCPPPEHGGKPCEGEDTQTQLCKKGDCADCPPDARNMYWYPIQCLKIETLTCEGCEFVAMWEFKPGNEHIDFVIRTSFTEKWTGFGITQNNGVARVYVGYILSGEEGYMGEYILPNGFNIFLENNVNPKIVRHFPDDYKNDGFNIRKISVNDATMLEMRIRLFTNEFPAAGSDDQFVVKLDFIRSGGKLGYLSKVKFDIAKDNKIQYETISNVKIQRCLGTGLELPGSEITCYNCKNLGCSREAESYPGKRIKCEIGTHVCQKFYGYKGSIYYFARSCGLRNSMQKDECSKVNGMVNGLHVEGTLCICKEPLCNAGNMIYNFFFVNILAYGIFYFV